MKRGIIGFKKTYTEIRTIQVGGKNYKKVQKEWKKHPYSIEEITLHDESFDEWNG